MSFEGQQGAKTCDGLSRRDFLRVGAISAGAVGLSLNELAQLAKGNGSRENVNCILLFLVGGPSQLDTWDLKPAAPSNVRGPFKPISTNVPGIEIAETFPQMAQMAHRYSIVRSLHHNSAPIHETGHQLLQTGRLSDGDLEHPHYGAVLSHLRGERAEGVPPFVVLPKRIGSTGVSVDHGQSAGYLATRHNPWVLETDPSQMRSRTETLSAIDHAHRTYDESDASSASLDGLFSSHAKRAFDLCAEAPTIRESYGRGTFGQSCLLARRLVENGVRLVTVNMFDTVFDQITWDCHADGGALGSTLHDYEETLCPTFDHAYSALLEDLDQRGLLETTLVVAMGEFGRTPHLNPRGGRDHWPSCWSMLFAGGGVKGGQIVGSSDKVGGEPRDRGVTPAEVAATIYHQLGVDLTTQLPSPGESSIPLVDASPISELLQSH